MKSFLQNHPFPVEAFFESSLVLTYAMPKDDLKDLIPPCLELDTFNDQWAFIAVAVVQTRNLRPKGFPAFMGNDFLLAGYRIFVRYTTSKGKRIRGLYILRSDTDKAKMALLGNIFTHYRYSAIDISVSKGQDLLGVKSVKSALELKIRFGNESINLPAKSPFKDWKEARRFSGPLPFTFTYNEETNDVLIIEGVRENWTPRPVEVQKAEVGFLKTIQSDRMVLANAFLIENIPYYWKKGVKDRWVK